VLLVNENARWSASVRTKPGEYARADAQHSVPLANEDFNRIGVIGDLIRHIEILDTRGDNVRRSQRNRI
jgi:hypothetical protein